MSLPWLDVDEFLRDHPPFTAALLSATKGPTVTAFQPVHHADLVALVDVTWPDGREEKEIRYYREGTRRWVTPALRFVGTDRHYWLSTFTSLESQQHYQDQILAAIDAHLAGGDGHVG
jgi:hypothetical protein